MKAVKLDRSIEESFYRSPLYNDIAVKYFEVKQSKKLKLREILNDKEDIEDKVDKDAYNIVFHFCTS